VPEKANDDVNGEDMARRVGKKVKTAQEDVPERGSPAKKMKTTPIAAVSKPTVSAGTTDSDGWTSVDNGVLLSRCFGNVAPSAKVSSLLELWLRDKDLKQWCKGTGDGLRSGTSSG
jgi:hypothetical protein